MDFNKNINIDKFKLGYQEPVFIIAEIGVNHNGDMALAKKMIASAAESGADCVKFQTFSAERVVTESAPKANYQLKTTDPSQTQLNMLRQLEMPESGYKEIIHCCQEHNVMFMSTPYNIQDVDFLDCLGVSAFKLASIHSAEPWFVKYVAQKGKPIILATGMADLDELRRCIINIKSTGNPDLVLLQCTTNYPSRLEDANIQAMLTMEKEFNVLVGYSDHTQDDLCCIVAASLGAKVIEKHFTLDRTMPGPDHLNSAEPKEFAHLVEKIRSVEKVLGSSIKEPCAAEKENAMGMRRSIVASRDIVKGTLLTEEMITFKRPATGLSPSCMEQVIGKIVNTNLPKDAFIQLSHILK